MKLAITTALVFLTMSVQVFADKKKDSPKEKKNMTLPSLSLTPLREMTLKSAVDSRGAFVSAASGIVRRGDRFFVIADDERFVYSFKDSDTHLTPHRFMEGTLPAANDKRKLEKPDMESMAVIPESDWPPYGALVLWPSGSTPVRMKASVLPFNKDGGFEAPVISNILPLAYVMQPLAKELNIEGIMIRDGKVFLFQRGNSKVGKNGIFEMPLKAWIKGLKDGDWKIKPQFQALKMGTLSGVQLGFADATWTKYGLLALASAEDTQSSFADGMVYGTTLVRVVGNKVDVLAKFDPVTKLEGIHAEETADGLELFLVEDADNPEKAGKVYKAAVPSSLLQAVNKK